MEFLNTTGTSDGHNSPGVLFITHNSDNNNSNNNMTRKYRGDDFIVSNYEDLGRSWGGGAGKTNE